MFPRQPSRVNKQTWKQHRQNSGLCIDQTMPSSSASIHQCPEEHLFATSPNAQEQQLKGAPLKVSFLCVHTLFL